MAARFYIAVVGVMAGCVGLTFSVIAQIPQIEIPQPMSADKPVDQSSVQDAIKAMRTGLVLPGVSSPPAELPQSLPAPTPLPVAPTPAPIPPSTLPPIPIEAPPVITSQVGGLTVDGHPLDLSMFRNRLGGGCATCGHDDCETCGGSRHCSPGRKACEPFPARNRAEQLIGLMYETICCPDPCYDPKWTALADSAFFTATARPVSQSRFRWDAGPGVILPDRAEYFWARADGSGLGPRPISPNKVASSVDYNELHQYTEMAVNGSFSTIIDLGYRTNQATGASAGSGFTDMTIGTKALMFDREIMQLSFQFLTFLPIGNSLKGTGTGHVSLEPSLIAGLKLSSDTFLQAQFADRIPIGSISTYSGTVLAYNLSLNHIIWRPVRDVQLITTCELNGLMFLNGMYTDPVLGPRPASGMTYLTLGPGIRLNICDKCDFGVGSGIAVTDPHFANAVIRTEFRYRY